MHLTLFEQMSVMPVMAKERAAFYREQASSSYSVFAYAVSYGTPDHAVALTMESRRHSTDPTNRPA
jgi:hypothetical protein